MAAPSENHLSLNLDLVDKVIYQKRRAVVMKYFHNDCAKTTEFQDFEDETGILEEYEWWVAFTIELDQESYHDALPEVVSERLGFFRGLWDALRDEYDEIWAGEPGIRRWTQEGKGGTWELMWLTLPVAEKDGRMVPQPGPIPPPMLQEGMEDSELRPALSSQETGPDPTPASSVTRNMPLCSLFGTPSWFHAHAQWIRQRSFSYELRSQRRRPMTNQDPNSYVSSYKSLKFPSYLPLKIPFKKIFFASSSSSSA